MLLAIKNGERVEARPGARATCPCCGGAVVSKCGSILVWHWAHEKAECDPWYEPESEWHIKWKQRFPVEWQEVVLGCHRADIKTPKLVVELQAGAISPEEIRERERHYGNMVWLLRGEDFSENIDLRKQSGYLSFRWKWPRKSWWEATKPMVIDLPTGMIHVRKLHHNTPCGGWAKKITLEQFMARCGAFTQPHNSVAFLKS